MADSQAEQVYRQTLVNFPVRDGDPNNTKNALKQVEAYTAYATTQEGVSYNDALKLFMTSIAVDAEKKGRDYDDVYAQYPKELKSKLLYQPKDLNLNQSLTIAGIKLQLGAHVGYLLGLTASVIATIALRSKLPGWAKFPPLLIGLYGLTGFMATFSQTIGTIVNNWNDVYHWGPLILQGQLQDLEKDQSKRGGGGGSGGGGGFTSGGGPRTIIRMVEEKKPKQFLGTLFSLKLGKMEHFDRKLDDEITDKQDLEADVKLALARWLKTLPGRLGASISIRKDPVDEFGAQQSGIWATQTLFIQQLSGHILPIDTILLGPVNPVMELELLKSTKTFEVQMPEVLSAKEVREIELPDGTIDIFNKAGERVFPGGGTAPAAAPAAPSVGEAPTALPGGVLVAKENTELQKELRAQGYTFKDKPNHARWLDASPPVAASSPAPAPNSGSSISTPRTTAPMLRVGSTGEQVKWLQEFLNTRGENLVVDGIFGPRTDAAVGRFQYKEGLVSDGVVGPKTYAAISKYF